MVDLLSLMGIVAIFLPCSILGSRALLREHANSIGTEASIQWPRLAVVTVACGLVFSAVWMLPIVLLSEEGAGPFSLGYTYVAGLVVLQTIMLMPVLSSQSYVARRVLPPRPVSESPDTADSEPESLDTGS